MEMIILVIDKTHVSRLYTIYRDKGNEKINSFKRLSDNGLEQYCFDFSYTIYYLLIQVLYTVCNSVLNVLISIRGERDHSSDRNHETYI